MMIVKLTPETVKTCLRLRAPGYDWTPRACAGWVVRVRRVGVQVLPDTYNCASSNCWGHGGVAAQRPAPRETRAIEYRAFEIDDAGRVCFYWDDKLLDAEPGRYEAVLFDGDKRELVRFQLDLAGSRLAVDQALNITAAVDCEADGVDDCAAAPPVPAPQVEPLYSDAVPVFTAPLDPNAEVPEPADGDTVPEFTPQDPDAVPDFGDLLDPDRTPQTQGDPV